MLDTKRKKKKKRQLKLAAIEITILQRASVFNTVLASRFKRRATFRRASSSFQKLKAAPLPPRFHSTSRRRKRKKANEVEEEGRTYAWYAPRWLHTTGENGPNIRTMGSRNLSCFHGDHHCLASRIRMRVATCH